MTKRKLPTHYRELLDAAQTINEVGPPIITYPLLQFKAKWLPRFLDEHDESVRMEWAKEVTLSPYVSVKLTDEEGKTAVTVPPLMMSKGDFIDRSIDLGDFIARHNYAKGYANGYRAVELMESLAARGVIRSGINVNDLKQWVDFYTFFGESPKWILGAKKVLAKLNVQNNSSANDTVRNSNGESNDFGDADDFEPL